VIATIRIARTNASSDTSPPTARAEDTQRGPVSGCWRDFTTISVTNTRFGRTALPGALPSELDLAAPCSSRYPTRRMSLRGSTLQCSTPADARSYCACERPCWCWDHHAEFLYRRSFLSLGQDPTISRSTRCAFVASGREPRCFGCDDLSRNCRFDSLDSHSRNLDHPFPFLRLTV
jgi:hypothetical protein